MIKKLLLLLLIVFTTSSCAHKLVGDWNVKKFETFTPNEQGVAFTNIGTIKFKKNDAGEKDISYSVFGVTKKDNSPFKWKATKEFLVIDSESSELNRTWLLIKNTNRTQIWKSTEGKRVQIVELTKIKKPWFRF